MKIKLLIASTDEGYANHLSRVLVERHAELFEVSVCSSGERLSELLSSRRFDAALAEPALSAQGALSGVRLLLTLWDEQDSGETGGGGKIRKYQRVSSIVRDVLEHYAAVSSKDEVFGGSRARVTAVWSPAGGSGKTTAALAYAAQAVAAGRKTVYLDLQSFSCSPVYFPQTGRSISALFEKLDGNIELLLQSVRQQDNDSGIYYFCQPENYEDIAVLSEEDLSNLMAGCALGVDELVVDLSSVCDERTQTLLKQADAVLLVTDASKSAKAKWEQFRTQHNLYDELRHKATLVANRGAQPEDAEGLTAVRLPCVQSANPVVVYKTLSAHFAR